MTSYQEIKERVKKHGIASDTAKSNTAVKGSERLKAIKDNIRANGMSSDGLGVNADYVDKFFSDAEKYFAGIGDRYNSMNVDTALGVYSDIDAGYRDLQDRYGTLRTWLGANKGNMTEDDYKKFTDALESVRSGSYTVQGAFSDAKDYYGQWESQKDYEAALKYNEEQKKYREHDTVDADTKITSYKELSKLLDGADAANKALTAIPKSTGMSTSEYYALIQSMNGRAPSRGADPSNKATYDITTFNSSLDKLKKLYEAANNGKTTDDIDVLLSTYEKNLKKVQSQLSALGIDDLDEYERYNTQAKRVQEFDGLVNNAKGAEDFQYYAQVGGNIQNPEFGKAKLDDGAWLDNLINGREDINNIVTFSRANKEKLQGMVDSNNTYAVANKYLKYAYMTDEEAAIYNYYLGKGDTGSAGEYLAMLNDTLMQRKGQERADIIGDSKALALLFSVEAGIDQTFSGLKNLDNYFKGTEADATTDTQYASGIIRDNLEGGWGVAYDALSTTSAMLPSILVSAVPVVGQPLALATLGGSAIGNSYAEMRNLGYSAEQARSYATLVGASEVALQSILGGISKLGGKYSVNAALTKLTGKVDNALARVAITLGGNMASEGLEEAIQTALEPYFKAWTTGEDFEGAEWDEIIYSALLGALSAGMVEGVPTIVGTAKSTISANRGAKEVFGDGSGLVADSLELGGDVGSLAEKYQQKRLDKGKELKGSQINRLVGKYDTQKMKSATEARLTALGEKGDVGKLADVLVKQAQGKSLTRAERDIIEASGYSTRVAAELDAENIFSGEYSTAWSEKIGTKRTNAVAYNLEEAKTQAAKSAMESGAVNSNVTKSANELAKQAQSNTSGKTLYKDEAVKVKRVVGVKGGIKVELANGMTVKASDLSFSATDSMMYSMLAKMNVSPETANMFLQAYKPESVKSGALYLSNIALAYQYGKIGNEAGLNKINMPRAQKELAYKRGRADADFNAKSGTKTKSGEQKSVPKRGIIFENGLKYNETQANDLQKTSMAYIELIDSISNLEVHIFASEMRGGVRAAFINGKWVKAPNGYFKRGNQIYIDINAGAEGEGAMLYTLAHEITHYIRKWNKTGFKELADFLIAEYGKQGVSVQALIDAQANRIKNRYVREKRALPVEAQLFDMAYEELVADAMSDMLADEQAYEKLAKLKEQNRSLWEKIGDAIKAIIDKLANALGIYKTEARNLAIEQAEVREFSKNVFDKLQDLYLKAFVEADANYDAAELGKSDDGIMLDGTSASVAPMLSERTWTASDYVIHRDQMAKKISEALGVSVNKAKSYIDDINSIARMIADDRVRLDYEASSFGSAFVSNVEYGGSFDYTTLCKKRRIYTGTFTEIQKRLKNTALTPDDILTIRNMMIEEGIEATCGLCYVEGSRANMGKFAKEFIRLYKRDNPNAWIPNMADVNTPDGVEEMRISHPEAYDQYVYFWNHYGKLKDSDPALFASQQKPKLYEARKEYKGEILQHFKGDTAVEKKNLNGGIRMQSFSDFEIVHLIDTMQVIMDMSTVGLAGQAYTKVPEFAKAFGNTGLKINLSLIAKGVDAKGNLIFDDREGMPHETAFELRNKYSENVGTIIVAFTDEQLLAAMADPRIDFIIPFHRSQWKKGQYGAMGLPKGTKDYTFMQNEKLIKKTYHEYRGRMVLDKASNYMPNEYWDFSKSGKENAETYLKMCAENNKRPKFYKLLDYDGKGTYSLKADGSTDGYWKLLIDFKMYDNNGVGSPQRAVTPTFNMDEARTMLDEYKGGHASYPVAHSVVDKFVNQYEGKGEDMMFSDRDFPSNAENIAKDYFGTTNKWSETGFLLKDGTQLDFSGRHWKKDPESEIDLPESYYNGKRNSEHYEIAEAFPEYRDVSDMEHRGEILYNFLKRGNIRIVGKGTIELYTMPTEEQYEKLYNYFRENKGHSAYIGIGDADGFSYASGTSSSTIIEGIRDYFAKNRGKQSDLMRFHTMFSDRDTYSYKNYSSSDYYTNGEIYSYDFLTAQKDMVKVKLPETGALADRNGRIDDEKVLNNGIKNALSEGTERGGKIYVKNTYTGRELRIDNSTIKHGLDGRYNRHLTNARIGSVIGSVAKNAIPINGLKNASEKAVGTYAMVAYCHDSRNREFIAVITVEQHTGNVDSFELYDVAHAVSGRQKNGSQADTKSPGVYPIEATTISIAQLLEFVNTTHQSILSDDVLAHFGETRNPKGSYSDKVLFSDRDGEVVSNRNMLANALEDTVQTEAERKRLQEYKNKIALIEADQKRLTAMRQKAQELRTKKGRTPKETQTMRDLDNAAREVEKRITNYDKKLLSLESTEALKKVLERERAKLKRDLMQRGKAALKAQREKDRAELLTFVERNRESRKAAVERHNKTEVRGKIKKVVKELNTMLLNPTSKKYIIEDLRREVADALDAINMDTVGADERVARYNELIAKAKDEDIKAELIKTRDYIQAQGDNLATKLAKLKVAYEKIEKSEDIELALSYQQTIRNGIESAMDKVGKTSIRDMSLEQLEIVYDLVKMIRTTIRDANKAFGAQRGETIIQMAEGVKSEVVALGKEKYERNVIAVALAKIKWALLKPFVAFRTIGSKTLTSLYQEMRRGEDTFYTDVNDAKDFIQKMYDKYGYDKWDMKKTEEFTSRSGKTFNLTLEQRMSVYAYFKREQAHKHIMEGGFVLEDALVTHKSKLGVPMRYEVTTRDAFNLTEEAFHNIAYSLTEEQRGYVDEMQEYLSRVMGAKGNEVSMKLLGVKLFKEENYIPIKSSQYYMNFKPEEAGEIKLKNPAFSKEVVKHAQNPIVMHNFTDLWAEHVNDMAMYHSFVLALEDFTKVYNFNAKEGEEVTNVKAVIDSSFPGAIEYINQFLRDLNGGVRADTVGWAERLTSLAKKSAVLGSLSVAVQQPSALPRAMALVNPKYFVAAVPKSLNPVGHRKAWDELKKYAPIAGIKEMGKFDVGMGQATVDYIQSNQTVYEKGEEFLSKIPAYMDEMTWLAIWDAVKRETLAKNKALVVGSDAHLSMAGERFTDVISLTQVYDSVFARSQLMRNKSWIAKTVTAFMAEPITTFNMIFDAFVQAHRQGGVKAYAKALGGTGGAVAASILLNAVLKSIVTAARDDDEDKTYTEKYLGDIVSNARDSFNPLTYIPVAKDIVSIFQGYDVERMDMTLISDLKNAIDAFESDSKSEHEKWNGLIGAISALFGVPYKNVVRDVYAIYNTIANADTLDTTRGGIKNALEEAWTGEELSKTDKIYRAVMSNDTRRVKLYEKSYDSTSKYETALKKGLRDNDSRIKDAAKARIAGNNAEYKRIAKEIIAEGNFSQDIVVGAIIAEENALKKGESTSTETREEVTSIYKVSDVNSSFEYGDTAMALEIIEDIVKTKKANGKTEEQARASVRSSMTSYWKPLYENAYLRGDKNEMDRIKNILIASGVYGKTSAVKETLSSWQKNI